MDLNTVDVPSKEVQQQNQHIETSISSTGKIYATDPSGIAHIIPNKTTTILGFESPHILDDSLVTIKCTFGRYLTAVSASSVITDTFNVNYDTRDQQRYKWSVQFQGIDRETGCHIVKLRNKYNGNYLRLKDSRQVDLCSSMEEYTDFRLVQGTSLLDLVRVTGISLPANSVPGENMVILMSTKVENCVTAIDKGGECYGALPPTSQSIFTLHSDCDEVLRDYSVVAKEMISCWYPQRLEELSRMFLAERRKAAEVGLDGGIKKVMKASIFEFLVDEQRMRRKIDDLASWAASLRVGDIVDAMDEVNKWYEAIIRYIEDTPYTRRLHLHYIGWRPKWGEIINTENVSRIARRGTHTDGPHRWRPRDHSRNTQYPNLDMARQQSWVQAEPMESITKFPQDVRVIMGDEEYFDFTASHLKPMVDCVQSEVSLLRKHEIWNELTDSDCSNMTGFLYPLIREYVQLKHVAMRCPRKSNKRLQTILHQVQRWLARNEFPKLTVDNFEDVFESFLTSVGGFGMAGDLELALLKREERAQFTRQKSSKAPVDALFGHSLSDSDHFEDEALEKRRRRKRKDRGSRSVSVSPPPIFRDKYDPEEREIWRAKKLEKQKMEQSHHRTSSRSPPPMFRDDYDPEEWMRNDKHIAWRNYLLKGKRVDVFDHSMDKKWYKGRVTEVGTANNGRSGYVKVHYDGFNPKYDEWLCVYSEHLARIFTHTMRDPRHDPMPEPNSDGSDDEESHVFDVSLEDEQWRALILLGHRLDIYDRMMDAWYKGRVIEMGTEDNGHVGEVKVTYDGYASQYDEWLTCDSPYLAPICKHTMREMNSLAVDTDKGDVESDHDSPDEDDGDSSKEESS